MTQTQQQNVPALRFPEFNGEWERKKLCQFLNFKNGVNADKSKYGFGYKFINVLDIIADRPITSENIIGSVSISENEFKKNEVVFGDILFQRSSETREEVGQSNVYLDKEYSATFGGFVIRGHPITKIVPQFFDALLKTNAARKDITTRSGGSASGCRSGGGGATSTGKRYAGHQCHYRRILQGAGHSRPVLGG